MLKAQLIAYNYDISNTDQAQAHAQLERDLKKLGLKKFNCLWTGGDNLKSGIVHLETKHVFDNQWNTSEDSPSNPKRRVMDWNEPQYPNKSLRRGYYIVPNDHMKTLRATTFKCGYCWHQSKETGFCSECLKSPYLEEDNLHLLRLQTVLEDKRAPLTEDESNYLLPLYHKAQAVRVEKLHKEKRAELHTKAAKAIARAETERDGFLWLMDKNINTENCIYYSHTNTFSFGWRNPINPEARKLIETALQGFPFNYEFK